MQIQFKKVRYKNVLSTGNVFTEINLDKSKTTLVSGSNGSGKCLRGSTEVEIGFVDKDVMKKFKEFAKQKV